MFRPVIVGRDISELVRRHGSSALNDKWPANGRYWSLETFYLYTLAWDPFILNRTGCVPSIHDGNANGDQLAYGKIALFYAHESAAADLPLIERALLGGGAVMLQQPEPELLDVIGAPSVADRNRPCLVSLRERWKLGDSATREYYYPDQQKFLRLAPKSSDMILSHLGGNPDLVLSGRSATWAGNAMTAAASYTNMPGVLSNLLLDLASLIERTISHFLGQHADDVGKKRPPAISELRRDFHSLGYAYLTVQELARCLNVKNLDLSEVESLALDAAGQVVGGDAESAERTLARSLEALASINRRTLQPKPATFTDTLHGGELYPDIGYFEIDWPQHPIDVIDTYLKWAKTRSYRFNVDFGATTVRELAIRYPDLFATLKEAQDEQIVEFVNGSCNQPYPPLHSLESQIRQFDVGRQVWQEVFGRNPRTYASQEFGFCPQLAAVLAQQGYDQAVVRVQNMGDAPTVHNSEQIDWIAPSGDSIRALPSHPHKSEQLNAFTYNNLHLKIYQHQMQSSPELPLVFTCLGDITYHRPMREELARACHYAPVFGSFKTFGQYFDETRELPSVARRLHMRDFNCDAGFLNIGLWPIYSENTGNFNTNCMRSLAATSLLAASEFLDGMTLALGGSPAGAIDHDANWEALAHYQGHGTYIVPRYPSGAFLGGIGSPRTKHAGRGVANVAEYNGPFSPRLMREVTEPLMDQAQQSAADLIQQRLLNLMATSGDGIMLLNYAPARRRVVSLTDMPGRSLNIGGNALYTQAFGDQRLALVDLPSYGVVQVDRVDGSEPLEELADPVQVGSDFLENRALRVEFDLQTGTIRRLFCKISRCDLLADGSHFFYCPDSRQPRCVSARITASGPLRGCIEFDIELPVANQQSCRIRTRASLDTQQSVVDFETEVLIAPELRGNQWQNHLGVRFAMPDRISQVQTSHFNVLETHSGQQLFSPYVIVAATGEKADVALFNEGNEFYLHQESDISNILIVQNEECRRFRYAAGRADRNPLMQARKWQQPVVVSQWANAVKQTDVEMSVARRLKSKSVSFLTSDSSDVELLSCRMIGDSLRLRIANTSGELVHTQLSMILPIASAELTSLNGSGGVSQPIADGQTKLVLRPWDVVQLSIQLQARVSPPQRKPARKADALQRI